MRFNEPSQEEKKDDALIFLLASFGTGQPTDNAKDFIKWLNSDDETAKSLMRNRKYAVFGLGNSRTHTQNYNIVGKNADVRLEELGGKRIHALGLGDDSECIEDDFDSWSRSLIETLSKVDDTTEAVCASSVVSKEGDTSDQQLPHEEKVGTVCFGELAQQQRAQKSAEESSSTPSPKFPELILNEHYPSDRELKLDLFGFPSFYVEGTHKLRIVSNKMLAPCRESLREAAVSFDDECDVPYEVGDLLWIYPQNHPAQVAAYAKAVNVNSFAIIEGVKAVEAGSDGHAKPRPYPYPIGLTLSETLQHCVDLSAVPSLTLARFILGRNIDYRSVVAEPRRTTLDLLLEPGSRKLTITELLYQLPPMRPRYYSIASSPIVHPNEIIIAYRPVKYITSRGVLREGVTTSYLNATLPAYDDDEKGEHGRVFVPSIAAGILRNPGFRLPEDPSTPIMMVAGGCGIAPFRSFLDERLIMAQESGVSAYFGDAYLFFGVRNKDDEVYNTLIDHALKAGVLTKVYISHSSSCCNPRFVSSDIETNGAMIYDLLERGGRVYLCGGASGLAWSCVKAIKEIIAKYGNMSAADAEEYFSKLLREGRYAEDISD